VAKGTLTIVVDRKMEKCDKGAEPKLYYSEMRYGKCSRTISLQTELVDPKGIEATLVDGVLTLKLRKRESSEGGTVDKK
jgi:HSP20 family molecular chaperone IbpA